jgi:cbb3-type cytochrome oxidase subunit 1
LHRFLDLRWYVTILSPQSTHIGIGSLAAMVLASFVHLPDIQNAMSTYSSVERKRIIHHSTVILVYYADANIPHLPITIINLDGHHTLVD